MSYIVIDLETNIKNTIGNNKGSSHCKDNEIVWWGHKKTGREPELTKFFKENKSLRDSGYPIYVYSNIEVIVGHNVKFDLLYLLRDPVFKSDVFPNKFIWDTALVEFIITGQEHKFPALNECAIKYGGTVKPERIKELWDAGVDTDDIDDDLMREYLTGDVLNTELVFLKQFEFCKENGLLPLVWSQMSALKATTMMEHNGMKIDVKELADLKYEKTRELADLKNEVFKILIHNLHPKLAAMEVDNLTQFLNMDSPQFISKVLYGGTCEFTTKEPDGVYKSGAKKGLTKTRNVTHEVVLNRIISPLSEWETAKKGIYKVGEDELKEILVHKPMPEVELFINTLLQVRELSKEVGTYIEGISNLIYEDGCIHGNLQHTVAITGRLTSSNPNLQNFTNPED